MAGTRPLEHLPGSIRLAEVLAAFSLATDLGAGQPMGFMIRTCYISMCIGRTLGLSPREQTELYDAALLMNCGCTAKSPPLTADELAATRSLALSDPTNPLDVLTWIARNVAPEAPFYFRARRIAEMLAYSVRDMKEDYRGDCEVAARIAQRLGMPPGVEQALLHRFERWDGKGLNGLRETQISLSARIVHLAMKIAILYDLQDGKGAEQFAVEQKGKAADPRVVDAFLAMAANPDFWRGLAQEDQREAVLDMEPVSPFRYIGEDRLDDVALAFADFADLKAISTVGHSKGAARLAEAIAVRMGLPPSEVAAVRRAGLVHDLGNVAIPRHILDKSGPLTEAEKELVRLHPYYTERILSDVPALRAWATIAGAHHEWMNGEGYYRGMSGNQIPVGAQILAVADEFDERSRAKSGLSDPEPEGVMETMRPEVGPRFSPEAFDALSQEFGVVVQTAPRRRRWPAGLTDREVEVLRLVAKGLSNRQIAQALSITEKTAGHHLEHIYNKIGISSRAAAVFFAMEHELIA